MIDAVLDVKSSVNGVTHLDDRRDSSSRGLNRSGGLRAGLAASVEGGSPAASR